MVARRRAKRGNTRGPGAGGQHTTRDVARASWRSPGRLLRPALAVVYRSGLLFHRRHRAGGADCRRADAAGLLLAFTFASRGVALQQPSWGATIPELVPRTQPGGIKAGSGQRQSVARGRTGTGRAGHHVPGRGPGRLRVQRAVGGLPGVCPALLAPAAAKDRRPKRALRAGTPSRWTVRLARTRGATHCAAGDPVRDAGDGIVGAVTAGRQPAAWPRGGRLRRVVRRGRGWRHTRR